MIIPAHDATRESWARSHWPTFGSVSPSHSRIRWDTCSVQACSAALGGAGVATTLVEPSGIIVIVTLVVLAAAGGVLVRDEGKSRPRHVSRKGRFDIHWLRLFCNW